ncbi:hypothetical protein YSY43_33310 [Paenibacillus sp. YSY-4.3]
MIHIRRTMVWFTASVFALFMIFFIPHPALNSGHVVSLEQSAVAADEPLRKSENKAAHLPLTHAKISNDQSPFYLLIIPAAASGLLALAGIYFRPFFYQLMKRILLLPIKFTSIYAA